MSSRNDALFETSIISLSQLNNDQNPRLSKRFRPSVQCHHINKQTNEQCTAEGFMECVHCDQICCLNHITQHQDELRQFRDNLVQVRCLFDCIYFILLRFFRKLVKLISP
jgi:hypothetical protein